MMSITITCMTSVLAIVSGVTLRNIQMSKDDFTTKCIVVEVIFEDSASGVIFVPADKINKMAECGSPRLGVNVVGFLQQ